MDEDAAREVLLVRALETGADSRALVGEADRLHAARTATELARWGATTAGAPPSPEAFLAHRARLLVERLSVAQPAVARASRALAWRPAVGVVVVVAALLFGALVEQVADRRQVNVLAFPLLGIVGWNLVVYLWLLLQALRRAARGGAGRGAGAARAAAGGTPDAPGEGAGTGAGVDAGALRAALVRVATRAAGTARGPLAGALASFAADWSRAVAPLAAARAARILHLAAALLATGAVAGLYLRGLVFDYRVGWESTFLGAPAVQALLATVLGPAAALLGWPFPDVDAVAAIRFPAGATGAAAARWIHLHALTVLLAVIVPRLLLAAAARWREVRLARRVPLDLDSPYFRRLLAPFVRGESRLRVVPFTYTVDEAATAGLREVARALLGDEAGLVLSPPVAYGEEARAAEGLAAGDPAVGLTLALCSLAATPEVENHGRFLEALRGAVGPRRPFALLLDEAPLRRRLGPGGGARIEERRQAWEAFAAARGIAVASVDLAAPDLALLERRFGGVLGGSAA